MEAAAFIFGYSHGFSLSLLKTQSDIRNPLRYMLRAYPALSGITE